jgi:hypothetical protein
MDIGLHMNYTNNNMWKMRMEFDTEWISAPVYDHNTILRMEKWLEQLHDDDRQKAITNVRNTMDSYLERMWVYVAKENESEKQPDNAEMISIEQVTTGVEQVNLSTA